MTYSSSRNFFLARWKEAAVSLGLLSGCFTAHAHADSYDFRRLAKGLDPIVMNEQGDLLLRGRGGRLQLQRVDGTTSTVSAGISALLSPVSSLDTNPLLNSTGQVLGSYRYLTGSCALRVYDFAKETLSEFPLPDSSRGQSCPELVIPGGIAFGKDGWIGYLSTDIARFAFISPEGVESSYPLPPQFSTGTSYPSCEHALTDAQELVCSLNESDTQGPSLWVFEPDGSSRKISTDLTTLHLVRSDRTLLISNGSQSGAFGNTAAIYDLASNTEQRLALKLPGYLQGISPLMLTTDNKMIALSSSRFERNPEGNSHTIVVHPTGKVDDISCSLNNRAAQINGPYTLSTRGDFLSSQFEKDGSQTIVYGRRTPEVAPKNFCVTIETTIETRCAPFFKKSREGFSQRRYFPENEGTSCKLTSVVRDSRGRPLGNKLMVLKEDQGKVLAATRTDSSGKASLIAKVTPGSFSNIVEMRLWLDPRYRSAATYIQGCFSDADGPSCQ